MVVTFSTLSTEAQFYCINIVSNFANILLYIILFNVVFIS